MSRGRRSIPVALVCEKCGAVFETMSNRPVRLCVPCRAMVGSERRRSYQQRQRQKRPDFYRAMQARWRAKNAERLKERERVRVEKNRPTVRCPECGTMFKRTKQRLKFCQHECWHQAFNRKARDRMRVKAAQSRKPPTRKACVICGAWFETRRPNHDMTCSPPCSVKRGIACNKRRCKKEDVRQKVLQQGTRYRNKHKARLNAEASTKRAEKAASKVPQDVREMRLMMYLVRGDIVRFKRGWHDPR